MKKTLRWPSLCIWLRSSSTLPPPRCLRRHFHASRANRFDLLQGIPEALQLSHSCFQSVHTFTGLPWFLSIPLTGVLFRLLWLPVQYKVNRDQNRRQNLNPLLLAWTTAYRTQAARQFSPNDPQSPLKAERWVRGQLQQKATELQNKYGAKSTRWRDTFLGLAFLPVWLVNADTLRRMSGLETSFFAWFMGSSASRIDLSVVPAEPSFTTQGALWFGDLTLADPLLVLPSVFWGLQLLNYYLSGGKDYHSTKTRLERYARGSPEYLMLQRQLWGLNLHFWLAFSSGPLLLSAALPTGVVLFLIGSVGSQVIQKPALKWFMRLDKPIEPARRLIPMQIDEKLAVGQIATVNAPASTPSLGNKGN